MHSRLGRAAFEDSVLGTDLRAVVGRDDRTQDVDGFSEGMQEGAVLAGGGEIDGVAGDEVVLGLGDADYWVWG